MKTVESAVWIFSERRSASGTPAFEWTPYPLASLDLFGKRKLTGEALSPFCPCERISATFFSKAVVNLSPQSEEPRFEMEFYRAGALQSRSVQHDKLQGGEKAKEKPAGTVREEPLVCLATRKSAQTSRTPKNPALCVLTQRSGACSMLRVIFGEIVGGDS